MFRTLTAAQQAEILAHGQVRNWSIGIETSDLGYAPGKPGDESGFTEEQIETLAGILAYDSILWDIPLAYPETWFGTGTACHTEPFEYPFWTLFQGKSCPGGKKKLLMKSRVLPRAVEIKAAWGGGEDTGHIDHDHDHDHDEEDDMAMPELVGFFTCPAAGGTCVLSTEAATRCTRTVPSWSQRRRWPGSVASTTSSSGSTTWRSGRPSARC